MNKEGDRKYLEVLSKWRCKNKGSRGQKGIIIFTRYPDEDGELK
jgi:hypothetical protein